VDGEVDAAVGEGLLDLLDEDAFAVREGSEGGLGLGFGLGLGLGFGMLHAVAGGADDLDGDGVARGAEGSGDMVGLPEGELRASGADADGLVHGIGLDSFRTKDTADWGRDRQDCVLPRSLREAFGRAQGRLWGTQSGLPLQSRE
jgi:hypothetical protein